MKKLITTTLVFLFIYHLSISQNGNSIIEGTLKVQHPTNPSRNVTIYQGAIQDIIATGSGLNIAAEDNEPILLNGYGRTGPIIIGNSLAEARLNIQSTSGNGAGIKVENTSGHAQTWLPFTDGGVYLTGEYDFPNNKKGNIVLRTYFNNNNTYVDNLRINGATGEVVMKDDLIVNGETRTHGKMMINQYASDAITNVGLVLALDDRQFEKWGISIAHDQIFTNHTAGSLVFSTTVGLTAGATVAASIRPNGSYITGSDRKLKQDIKYLDNQEIYEKVLQLKPASYSYRNTGDELNYGLIAQDVQQVLPFLTSNIDKETLGINYDGLIPLLIASIQIQNEKITILKKQIDQLIN